MTAPKRVQMSRQHPWRAENPAAVIVDRRTLWGNPFRPVRCDNRHFGFAKPHWHVMDEEFVFSDFIWNTRAEATELAVKMFRIRSANPSLYPLGSLRAALAGKDLACWCALDQPCHADVLLEIANGVEA